jgi:hypothetical protein
MASVRLRYAAVPSTKSSKEAVSNVFRGRPRSMGRPESAQAGRRLDCGNTAFRTITPGMNDMSPIGCTSILDAARVTCTLPTFRVCWRNFCG